MVPLTYLVVIAACAATLASAAGWKVPLWIGVILLCLLEVLRIVPR